jgi:hypothetical protein
VARIETKKCAILQDYENFTTSPLNSRAWVFQERLLSARVIHYGKADVFWECRELVASGNYPAGFLQKRDHHQTYGMHTPTFHLDSPRKSKLDQMKLYSNGPRVTTFDVHTIWQSLSQWYARCEITILEHRLPAITGTAQMENRIHFQEKYIAGFFESQLPLALLWTAGSGE